MMEYKIKANDILKALSGTIDSLYGLIGLGIVLIFAYGMIARFGFLLLALIPGIFMHLFAFYGNGWQIENDQFKMKTGFTTKTVKISDMEIEMIAACPNWIPRFGLRQIRLPSLVSGKMRLGNGKDAWLFQHREAFVELVIRANGKYYIVSHENMGKLYEKLIELGAKESNIT